MLFSVEVHYFGDRAQEFFNIGFESNDHGLVEAGMTLEGARGAALVRGLLLPSRRFLILLGKFESFGDNDCCK